jgi:hypothetical protein
MAKRLFLPLWHERVGHEAAQVLHGFHIVDKRFDDISAMLPALISHSNCSVYCRVWNRPAKR